MLSRDHAHLCLARELALACGCSGWGWTRGEGRGGRGGGGGGGGGSKTQSCTLETASRNAAAEHISYKSATEHILKRQLQNTFSKVRYLEHLPYTVTIYRLLRIFENLYRVLRACVSGGVGRRKGTHPSFLFFLSSYLALVLRALLQKRLPTRASWWCLQHHVI